MNNLSDHLANTPQGKELLQNKKALFALLHRPETKTFFEALGQKDSGQLQAAAQAALQGDASLLNTLMKDLSQNPDTAKAVEELSKHPPR